MARDPSEALDAETARQLLRNARPAPWLPDRPAALKKLDETKLKPGRIIWATEGFDHDSAAAFSRGLAAGRDRGAGDTAEECFCDHLGGLVRRGRSRRRRARAGVPGATADIIAETAEGASIASTRLTFARARRRPKRCSPFRQRR